MTELQKNREKFKSSLNESESRFKDWDFLATIDFSGTSDSQSVFTWLEKTHPEKVFPAYACRDLSVGDSKNGFEPFEVWVPESTSKKIIQKWINSSELFISDISKTFQTPS